MPTLAEKLRAAREIKVESGPFVFTALRPTDVESMRLNAAADPIARSRVLASWVIGWAKKDGSALTEMDLGVPGGDAAFAVPFDPEACEAFLFDNVAIFQDVADKVTTAYAERIKAMGDVAKN